MRTFVLALLVGCTSHPDPVRAPEPSRAPQFVTAAGSVRGGGMRMDIRVGPAAISTAGAKR